MAGEYLQGLQSHHLPGGSQPGIQWAPSFVGHEVCGLHHEGESPSKSNPGYQTEPAHARLGCLCKLKTNSRLSAGVLKVHALPDQAEDSSMRLVQVYATSMAMVVTMAVSIVLFALVPSLQMLLGISTASISLILYYFPPSSLLASESSEAGAGKPLLPK